MKRPFVIFTFQIKETRVYSDGERHDYMYTLPIIAKNEQQKDAVFAYVMDAYRLEYVNEDVVVHNMVQLVNTRINDHKIHDWYADEVREKGFTELHSSMIATY